MKARLKPTKMKLQAVLVMLRAAHDRKYLIPWLRSFRPGYLLDQRLPWITFDAIGFLQAYLNRCGPGLRVFEYGSGGSTLFWLAHGAACVSVEHDQGWFATLRQRIGDSAAIDYRLVRPEPAPELQDGDPANPDLYLSDDPNFRGYHFRAYASQIDPFPDRGFDIVLIDGRARPACIKHSACRVKPGGLLVLDNADRPYYTAQTQVYLMGFTCHSFGGYAPSTWDRTRTDIYVRAGTES